MKTIFAAMFFAISAGSFAAKAEPEILEITACRYYDAYSARVGKDVDYHIGSLYTDQIRKGRIVRLIVFLPDGAVKVFNFDDRFDEAKPEKIESHSDTSSKLIFAIGASKVGVISAVHTSKFRPISYQVWTIDNGEK